MAIAASVAAPAAAGLGGDAVDSVSVLQLQSTAQLPETPEASVPVPSAPEVQAPEVTAPDVPEVQAPAVPEVQAPEVQAPQVSNPQVSGGGGQTAPSGSQPSQPSQPSQAATGGGGSAAVGGGTRAGSPGAAAGKRRDGAAGPGARDRRARAVERRRARERHVRSTVRRLSGCLDALPDAERSFLSIRAGLEGPPRSRGEAARELGVTRREGARLERGGLRSLRAACGGGQAFTGHARTVADAASGRLVALQPQDMLTVAAGARPLLPAERLTGRQAVAGVRSSGGTGSPAAVEGHGPAPVSGASVSGTVAAATSDPGAGWLPMAGLLLLAAVASLLLLLRGPRRHPLPVAADAGRRTAPPAFVPPREPRPERPAPLFATSTPPVVDERPPPPGGEGHGAAPPRSDEAPAPPRPDEASAPSAAEGVARPSTAAASPGPPARRNLRRAARPAAIAASGVLSVAARELMRRRRRR